MSTPSRKQHLDVLAPIRNHCQFSAIGCIKNGRQRNGQGTGYRTPHLKRSNRRALREMKHARRLERREDLLDGP